MFKSNVDDFLRQHKDKLENALEQMGQIGKDNIKDETPVRTGKLESENEYKRVDLDVYLYNEADYAPFVELGTMYMHSNPFMRRGIQKSRQQFTDTLKRNLSE